MDIGEYLLFIPLLIYGIVLSRLLGEWKRFFDVENWHGPYIVTIVVFTEIAIWNIYTYYEVFSDHPTDTYPEYLALLITPFLFLLSINALLQEETPDGVVDRDEFKRHMRLSYFFMGCFVLAHLLPSYGDDSRLLFRLPAMIVVFSIAWRRDERLIYLLGVVWLASLLRRVFFAI